MPKSGSKFSKKAAVGKKIKVHFATNRNRTTGGDLFGSDFQKPPPLFVTGTIDVNYKGGSHPAWCPDKGSLYIDPISKLAQSTIPQIVADAPSTENAITTFVENALQAEGFVFLHGFACAFLDSMSSSAQIAAAYGVKNVFCFSWPSQGKFGLVEYIKDKDSAYRSGTAIALALSTVFSKILSIGQGNKPALRLVAHSMGNRALSAAVQHISISAPELLATNYFKYALLMAADEDNNALEEPNKLKTLLTLADNIDIYTNQNDFAMLLSTIANFVEPIGWYGPTDFGTLPSKVIMVDCTDVGDTGFWDFGHQYFRNSLPVTADVHQVFRGVPPEKVSPRIPDRKFPKRKFVIPFSTTTAWARSRGY
jgi:esterase/lipase superfamily enzyme